MKKRKKQLESGQINRNKKLKSWNTRKTMHRQHKMISQLYLKINFQNVSQEEQPSIILKKYFNRQKMPRRPQKESLASYLR